MNASEIFILPPSYTMDVQAFHTKLELPVARCYGGDRRLGDITSAELEYRISFLKEELLEFVNAAHANDHAGMLDALVDLAWVCIGTAHYMGAPFHEAWQRVLSANLQKIRDTSGDHKRGAAEKIRKPVDWQPPDIAALIRSTRTLEDYLDTPPEHSHVGEQ